MKVSEAKEQLLKAGYTEEELSKKSTKELKEMAQATNQADQVLETADATSETSKTEASVETRLVKAEDTIMPYDTGWTDYVLSLMDNKEKIDGKPRVDGLRRVANLLRGPFSSETIVEQAPTIDNGGRATVTVRLAFNQFIEQNAETGERYRELNFDREQIVCGSADVYSGNTDRMFARHPVAVAETRAEGRALRKALLLRVISAEEAMGAPEDEPDGMDDRVTQSLLNGIVAMCQKAGFDIVKLIALLEFDVAVKEDLTIKQAKQLAQKINYFVQNPNEVPDNVRTNSR